MILSFVLLQTPVTADSPMPQYILLGGIITVFYLFMIRPQQRRQQAHRTFLETLKKGEAVVTIGGIHGKVSEVKEETVTLEIDKKGSKITMAKESLSLEGTQRSTKK